MSNLHTYYRRKSPHYGMSGLRERHILQLVSPAIRLQILDVGCATGYLGAKLKKMGHQVTGIDISTTAIQKAKKVLDQAYSVDIETQPLPTRKTFDLIIISEVIEHLFQPDKVIKKLLTRLKSGGRIIVTTPNISFWHNRLTFLLGHFAYTQQGMFDESHIHFFNYRSLTRLLWQNELTIIEENHVIFPYTLSKLLQHFPNLFAYQLVICIKK